MGIAVDDADPFARRADKAAVVTPVDLAFCTSAKAVVPLFANFPPALGVRVAIEIEYQLIAPITSAFKCPGVP